MTRLPRTAVAAIVLASTCVLAPDGVAPRAAHAAVTAADASPEEIARARRAFKKGEKLYALGRFEEALKEYEHAFEIVELPEFLFNIGQCQRNLERYDAAIFSFKQFLQRKPDAPNRAAVEDLLAELEGKRKRADVLKLTPRPEERRRGGPTGPAGAEESAPPIYKRWWFIAGAVGVGVVAGAVALSSGGGGGVPSSDLGNVDLP